MIIRGYLCTRIDSQTEVAPPLLVIIIIRNIQTMDNNNPDFQFADINVTYEDFVEDLATKIALRIHLIEKDNLKSAKQELTSCSEEVT